MEQESVLFNFPQKITLELKELLNHYHSLIVGNTTYHALQQPLLEDPPSMCALLPLFYEKAATPSMV